MGAFCGRLDITETGVGRGAWGKNGVEYGVVMEIC